MTLIRCPHAPKCRTWINCPTPAEADRALAAHLHDRHNTKETPMPTTFENEAAIAAHFDEADEPWLSLVAADGWPYLVTCSEDGDLFTQTFPTESEEGAAQRGEPIESGTLWLSQHPDSWYPVTLVAPLPQTTEAGR